MHSSLLRVPGPGEYNINDNLSRKSIRIAQKNPVNYDNRVPGPGVPITSIFRHIKYKHTNKRTGSKAKVSIL